MLAPTDAKRVGRNELRSPASSPRSSPDPDLAELLRSRIQSAYTFTAHDQEPDEPLHDAADSDDEAELVLFAGPATATAPHKIRLSSPDAALGDAGLLVKKPRSYYFAEEATGVRESEYKAAAVTGADVMDMSRVPWPGCAMPWKVRRITAAGLQKVVLVGHPPALVQVQDAAQKRRRKGKKSRIAIRKKLQATKDKEAEQAQLAQDQDAAEREKRTRKNREKKLKRKARDKVKKEVGADPDQPSSHDSGP